MILVIGGAHQGKYEYAKHRFSFSDEDVFFGDSSPYELLSQKKVIKDFHLLVKRLLQDEIPILEKIECLLESSNERIIISDEIGYGIVPMDRFERRYREETGRTCCYLAQRAEEVIRVYCGIATVIHSSKENV